MKFHWTLLYAAILLLMYPYHVASQQEKRPPVIGTQLYENALNSAEEGSPFAQFSLGMMYYRGTFIPPDPKEAAKWFEKAAEQNVIAAQFNLGMMYLKGEGISQNYDEAAKWLLNAAEQGDTSTQCMLGAIHIKGWGVTRDYVEAYRWLTLSIDGSKDPQILGKASNRRDLIEREITPGQIQEAKRMASLWKPSLKYTPFGVEIVSPTPEIMSNLRYSLTQIMSGSNNRSPAVNP